MKTRTIREVSSAWKAEKCQYVKQSSFSAYALIVENHILPYFGESTELSEAQVQKFVLEKLSTGLSIKSVKDIMIVLKMIMKYGVKHHYFDYFEWDIKYPTQRTGHKIDVLSPQEYKKLLRYTHDNFTFRNLGIYICLCTGLRIGEICALKWSDIDVSSSVITIQRTIERIYVIDNNGKHTQLILNTPKTHNSYREIPMSSELLGLMKSLKRIENSDYYILTNDKNPIEPRTYRNYYKQLMAHLKLPNLKFHGLRHSFATRCIENNCDYKTVSVLLGHSNITTTLNLYVHPNIDQKKKCINKMLKALH